MTDLAQDLAAAVERECNILQFREDHEARNERIDALMLKDAADARKRIEQARKAEADESAGSTRLGRMWRRVCDDDL